MGHYPQLPLHGWALKLEDFRSGGVLWVMRPEALRPPEISEKSLGRITTMPLTRFALHRELHHEPCLCPISTQLRFRLLCASFGFQAGSGHAFETRVSTEIKVYFSHSNKACPYPLGASEGGGRRGSLTPVPTPGFLAQALTRPYTFLALKALPTNPSH